MKTFDYNGNEVRTIIKNGSPWFVLKDVCDILEMDTKQIKKVADRLDDDEKGRNQITTHGGMQESWIINESGLYSVILRSDKPNAKPFRKWVTSEVLPTIRTTGQYIDTENKFQQCCPVSFKRAKCQKIVQIYALRKRRSPMHEIDAWRKLYIDFSKQIGYNINAKAKEEGVSKIEYLEKHGLVDQFIEFVENAIA